MEIKDLKPEAGSRKSKRRVGRGHSSGQGKTAGRGLNGQKSRAGGGKGPGFEGGQTPLARRLPKLPGFTNINRVEFIPVNVGRLNDKFEAGEIVDAGALFERGIIKHSDSPIKMLATGNLSKPLTLRVDKISTSARAKVENAGGKVELTC